MTASGLETILAVFAIMETTRRTGPSFSLLYHIPTPKSNPSLYNCHTFGKATVFLGWGRVPCVSSVRIPPCSQILRSKIESGLAASSAWKWLKWWLTPPANPCGNFVWVWGLTLEWGCGTVKRRKARHRVVSTFVINDRQGVQTMAVIFYSSIISGKRASQESEWPR